ncbi:MAG: hypothetical protein GYA62_01495 [Bacteroidales bacterium]|nr:hypothetical protein [Bacteroidales bacterium]
MQGTSEQGFVGLWPGESSWGPRYLSPLIPFGMLLVGFIYQKLSKVQKLFTVLPLVIIGTYIEIIGITMPYQIKYHYLEKNFFINYTEYNVYTYVNLLPRYSPIIMMTKNLYHLIKNFRRTTIPETYNVKMYDGISFAFDVGHERWRSIYNTGYIYFDNFKNDQISKISFDLINHPLSDTKEPLLLGFEINGQKIKSDITTIKITERKRVTLDTSNIKILPENNLLVIKAIYKTNNIINDNKQIAGIINMWINKTPINKELIRVPYVDQIGSKVVNAKYANWGNTAKDPWIYWDLHTQVYERTLDFWWIKPIYYWDFPKKPFLILFIFNVLGLGGSTYFLIKSLNFSHPKRSSAKRG